MNLCFHMDNVVSLVELGCIGPHGLYSTFCLCIPETIKPYRDMLVNGDVTKLFCQ